MKSVELHTMVCCPAIFGRCSYARQTHWVGNAQPGNEHVAHATCHAKGDKKEAAWDTQHP